jgi:OmpA-OmpF porin, OOP family
MRQTPCSDVAAPRACLVLCALFMGAGCAPVAIENRLQNLSRIAQSAAHEGAVQCAPEELALARVQLELARLELDQGEAAEAQRHLTLAEPNARAALHLATSTGCRHVAQRATPPTTSRPLVAVGGRHVTQRGAP